MKLTQLTTLLFAASALFVGTSASAETYQVKQEPVLPAQQVQLTQIEKAELLQSLKGQLTIENNTSKVSLSQLVNQTAANENKGQSLAKVSLTAE